MPKGTVIKKALSSVSDVWYFAYGSNMLRVRLAKHLSIPVDAFAFGKRVSAPGWQLVFNKPKSDGSAAANIAEDPKSFVLGVLYTLSHEQWESLKSSEGKGYRDRPIQALDGGE